MNLKNVNSTGILEIKQAKLLELLSNYLPQKKISKILKIRESAVSMAKKRYIKKGWINQDLTLTQDGFKKIKDVKSSRGYLETVKSDSVRGHNLVFTLQIPKISNWDKREQYFEEKKINFKKLKNTKSQRIIIDKRKIWLNPSSITFYMNHSYFAETSELAMKEALDDLFNIIAKIESKLKTRLRFTDGYKIRVSRQHYALVKNALAKEYDKDKKKLYLRDDSGLWLIIDNSFQLHELETVHPKTSLEDNQPIQDFFNDLKKNPATISQINNALMQLTQSQQKSIGLQEVYNQNIVKHLNVLEDMSKTMKSIQKALKLLEKKT